MCDCVFMSDSGGYMCLGVFAVFGLFMHIVVRPPILLSNSFPRLEWEACPDRFTNVANADVMHCLYFCISFRSTFMVY